MYERKLLNKEDKEEISKQIDDISEDLNEQNLGIKVIGSGESVKRNIDKYLLKSKCYEVTIKEIIAPF